ncbi:hypothetical protein FVO59_05160 [Microbacterium esteraromaticum]|uniref:SbsA Ig-like domain-containing protein n=1 Tax=Microbacterium esteraromaticum TaxID=57043 RepID=A0A7D7WHS3_9MICO|nr:hypothetical protein [Microbacterium esteraromaticum]QMU96670.1 hypothetical protein FVO59_05160 [Microbacterium esteraromaticum]
MSTDGSADQPLTRAQLRALRAAEEAGVEPGADAPDAGPVRENRPAPDASTPDVPSPAVPPPALPPLAVSPPEVSTPEAHAHAEASRPEQPARPRDRRFGLVLFSVLGVLTLVAGVLAVVSLVQGPRLSEVQVDPAQAIEASGSRLILTANQSLDTIDPEQVSVEPAVPFTVDASGRSVGIRFTVPLHDDTTYRVAVDGVTAVGGGTAADLETSFRTPASTILLLQRAEGSDKIFLSDLGGEKATPVFEHPRISDYRATADVLVVAVEEDDGSRLIVMNRDGSGQRELTLPGEGYVSSVQVSDRAGLVGYSYSDRDLTETSGRASVLVTQALSGADEPRVVQIDDKDANVAEWRFVPDSSSLLFIDFNGALSVEDPTGDAGPQSMGTAASILGVNRGTYTALIERADGSFVVLDLTDGAEEPLPPSEPDYGDAVGIEAFPGGTLRHVVQRDELGMPTGQAIVKVDDEGAATVIAEVSGEDSILQTCASPSGQYVAVTMAPDLANNEYDDLLLPLPTTMHTRLIDLVGDRELPTLSGFDISWCRTAPLP